MPEKSSDVVHFIQDQNSESTKTTVDHTKDSLNIATVKYTKKKKITDAENEGVLIFTTDTGEFYVGTGYDSFIKKISDVFVGLRSEFPGTGVINKIYFATDERLIYYWDKTKYVIFADVSVAAYQDIFTVTDTQTDFVLTKQPLNNVIAMNINGITYFPDDFVYNQNTNTVTWQNSGEDSFEIVNSKVVFEYDILADGDNVFITTDGIKSQKLSARISSKSFKLCQNNRKIVEGIYA